MLSWHLELHIPLESVVPAGHVHVPKLGTLSNVAPQAPLVQHD